MQFVLNLVKKSSHKKALAQCEAELEEFLHTVPDAGPMNLAVRTLRVVLQQETPPRDRVDEALSTTAMRSLELLSRHSTHTKKRWTLPSLVWSSLLTGVDGRTRTADFDKQDRIVFKADLSIAVNGSFRGSPAVREQVCDVLRLLIEQGHMPLHLPTAIGLGELVFSAIDDVDPRRELKLDDLPTLHAAFVTASALFPPIQTADEAARRQSASWTSLSLSTMTCVSKAWMTLSREAGYNPSAGSAHHHDSSSSSGSNSGRGDNDFLFCTTAFASRCFICYDKIIPCIEYLLHQSTSDGEIGETDMDHKTAEQASKAITILSFLHRIFLAIAASDVWGGSASDSTFRMDQLVNFVIGRLKRIVSVRNQQTRKSSHQRLQALQNSFDSSCSSSEDDEQTQVNANTTTKKTKSSNRKTHDNDNNDEDEDVNNNNNNNNVIKSATRSPLSIATQQSQVDQMNTNTTPWSTHCVVECMNFISAAMYLTPLAFGRLNERPLLLQTLTMEIRSWALDTPCFDITEVPQFFWAEKRIRQQQQLQQQKQNKPFSNAATTTTTTTTTRITTSTAMSSGSNTSKSASTSKIASAALPSLSSDGQTQQTSLPPSAAKLHLRQGSASSTLTGDQQSETATVKLATSIATTTTVKPSSSSTATSATTSLPYYISSEDVALSAVRFRIAFMRTLCTLHDSDELKVFMLTVAPTKKSEASDPALQEQFLRRSTNLLAEHVLNAWAAPADAAGALNIADAVSLLTINALVNLARSMSATSTERDLSLSSLSPQRIQSLFPHRVIADEGARAFLCSIAEQITALAVDVEQHLIQHARPSQVNGILLQFLVNMLRALNYEVTMARGERFASVLSLTCAVAESMRLCELVTCSAFVETQGVASLCRCCKSLCEYVKEAGDHAEVVSMIRTTLSGPLNLLKMCAMSPLCLQMSQEDAVLVTDLLAHPLCEKDVLEAITNLISRFHAPPSAAVLAPNGGVAVASENAPAGASSSSSSASSSTLSAIWQAMTRLSRVGSPHERIWIKLSRAIMDALAQHPVGSARESVLSRLCCVDNSEINIRRNRGLSVAVASPQAPASYARTPGGFPFAFISVLIHLVGQNWETISSQEARQTFIDLFLAFTSTSFRTLFSAWDTSVNWDWVVQHILRVDDQNCAEFALSLMLICIPHLQQQQQQQQGSDQQQQPRQLPTPTKESMMSSTVYLPELLCSIIRYLYSQAVCLAALDNNSNNNNNNNNNNTDNEGSNNNNNNNNNKLQNAIDALKNVLLRTFHLSFYSPEVRWMLVSPTDSKLMPLLFEIICNSSTKVNGGTNFMMDTNINSVPSFTSFVITSPTTTTTAAAAAPATPFDIFKPTLTRNASSSSSPSSSSSSSCQSLAISLAGLLLSEHAPSRTIRSLLKMIQKEELISMSEFSEKNLIAIGNLVSSEAIYEADAASPTTSSTTYLHNNDAKSSNSTAAASGISERSLLIATTLKAAIDWGDGSASRPALLPKSSFLFQSKSSHSYLRLQLSPVNQTTLLGAGAVPPFWFSLRFCLSYHMLERPSVLVTIRHRKINARLSLFVEPASPRGKISDARMPLYDDAADLRIGFAASVGESKTVRQISLGVFRPLSWFHVTCAFSSGRIRLYMKGETVLDVAGIDLPNFFEAQWDLIIGTRSCEADSNLLSASSSAGKSATPFCGQIQHFLFGLCFFEPAQARLIYNLKGTDVIFAGRGAKSTFGVGISGSVNASTGASVSGSSSSAGSSPGHHQHHLHVQNQTAANFFSASGGGSSLVTSATTTTTTTTTTVVASSSLSGLHQTSSSSSPPSAGFAGKRPDEEVLRSILVCLDANRNFGQPLLHRSTRHEISRLPVPPTTTWSWTEAVPFTFVVADGVLVRSTNRPVATLVHTFESFLRMIVAPILKCSVLHSNTSPAQQDSAAADEITRASSLNAVLDFIISAFCVAEVRQQVVYNAHAVEELGAVLAAAISQLLETSLMFREGKTSLGVPPRLTSLLKVLFGRSSPRSDVLVRLTTLLMSSSLWSLASPVVATAVLRELALLPVPSAQQVANMVHMASIVQQRQEAFQLQQEKLAPLTSTSRASPMGASSTEEPLLDPQHHQQQQQQQQTTQQQPSFINPITDSVWIVPHWILWTLSNTNSNNLSSTTLPPLTTFDSATVAQQQQQQQQQQQVQTKKCRAALYDLISVTFQAQGCSSSNASILHHVFAELLSWCEKTADKRYVPSSIAWFPAMSSSERSFTPLNKSHVWSWETGRDFIVCITKVLSGIPIHGGNNSSSFSNSNSNNNINSGNLPRDISYLWKQVLPATGLLALRLSAFEELRHEAMQLVFAFLCFSEKFREILVISPFDDGDRSNNRNNTRNNNNNNNISNNNSVNVDDSSAGDNNNYKNKSEVSVESIYQFFSSFSFDAGFCYSFICGIRAHFGASRTSVPSKLLASAQAHVHSQIPLRGHERHLILAFLQLVIGSNYQSNYASNPQQQQQQQHQQQEQQFHEHQSPFSSQEIADIRRAPILFLSNWMDEDTSQQRGSLLAQQLPFDILIRAFLSSLTIQETDNQVDDLVRSFARIVSSAILRSTSLSSVDAKLMELGDTLMRHATLFVPNNNNNNNNNSNNNSDHQQHPDESILTTTKNPSTANEQELLRKQENTAAFVAVDEHCSKWDRLATSRDVGRNVLVECLSYMIVDLRTMFDTLHVPDLALLSRGRAVLSYIDNLFNESSQRLRATTISIHGDVSQGRMRAVSTNHRPNSVARDNDNINSSFAGGANEGFVDVEAFDFNGSNNQTSSSSTASASSTAVAGDVALAIPDERTIRLTALCINLVASFPAVVELSLSPAPNENSVGVSESKILSIVLRLLRFVLNATSHVSSSPSASASVSASPCLSPQQEQQQKRQQQQHEQRREQLGSSPDNRNQRKQQHIAEFGADALGAFARICSELGNRLNEVKVETGTKIFSNPFKKNKGPTPAMLLRAKFGLASLDLISRCRASMTNQSVIKASDQVKNVLRTFVGQDLCGVTADAAVESMLSVGPTLDAVLDDSSPHARRALATAKRAMALQQFELSATAAEERAADSVRDVSLRSQAPDPLSFRRQVGHVMGELWNYASRRFWSTASVSSLSLELSTGVSTEIQLHRLLPVKQSGIFDLQVDVPSVGGPPIQHLMPGSSFSTAFRRLPSRKSYEYAAAMSVNRGQQNAAAAAFAAAQQQQQQQAAAASKPRRRVKKQSKKTDKYYQDPTTMLPQDDEIGGDENNNTNSNNEDGVTLAVPDEGDHNDINNNNNNNNDDRLSSDSHDEYEDDGSSDEEGDYHTRDENDDGQGSTANATHLSSRTSPSTIPASPGGAGNNNSMLYSQLQQNQHQQQHHHHHHHHNLSVPHHHHHHHHHEEEERRVDSWPCEIPFLMQCRSAQLTLTTHKIIIDLDRENHSYNPPVSQEAQEFLPTPPEQIILPLFSIKTIAAARRFRMRYTAVIVEMEDLTQALVCFKTLLHHDAFVASFRIARNGRRKVRDQCKIISASNRQADKKKLRDLWAQGELSNFEYLLRLNHLAQRTVLDFSQYPIFPWIVADYSSQKLDLENASTFRRLEYPVGLQGDREKREAELTVRFQDLEDLGDVPFHYFTHYSTVAVVLFYLVRHEPFTAGHVVLQGGRFDHADRMFHSVEVSWKGVSSSHQDVKELIPEFYCSPDFLINSNGVPFGAKQNGDKMRSVVLPKWAEGSPWLFVARLREALECQFVTARLHNWVDLVFGYKQRGPDAVEACNLFHPDTYEGEAITDDTNDKEDEARRQVIDTLDNIGQCPALLFRKPHRQSNMRRFLRKSPLSNAKDVFVKEIAVTPPATSSFHSSSTPPVMIAVFVLERNVIAFDTTGTPYVFDLHHSRIESEQNANLVVAGVAAAGGGAGADPSSISLSSTLQSSSNNNNNNTSNMNNSATDASANINQSMTRGGSSNSSSRAQLAVETTTAGTVANYQGSTGNDLSTVVSAVPRFFGSLLSSSSAPAEMKQQTEINGAASIGNSINIVGGAMASLLPPIVPAELLYVGRQADRAISLSSTLLRRSEREVLPLGVSRPGGVAVLATADEKQIYAVVPDDRSCVLVGLKSRYRARLTNHTEAITCMAVSADFAYLVTGAADCTCCVYSVEDLTGSTRDGIVQVSCSFVIQSHSAPITCVAVSSELDTIVTGDADGVVQFHSLRKSCSASSSSSSALFFGSSAFGFGGNSASSSFSSVSTGGATIITPYRVLAPPTSSSLFSYSSSRINSPISPIMLASDLQQRQQNDNTNNNNNNNNGPTSKIFFQNTTASSLLQRSDVLSILILEKAFVPSVLAVFASKPNVIYQLSLSVGALLREVDLGSGCRFAHWCQTADPKYFLVAVTSDFGVDKLSTFDDVGSVVQSRSTIDLSLVQNMLPASGGGNTATSPGASVASTSNNIMVGISCHPSNAQISVAACANGKLVLVGAEKN